MNGKREGKAKEGWECAELPKRSCAMLGHFLWQRSFPWLLWNCTLCLSFCDLPGKTMEGAFSFEKLFLRSGKKMTNLGERENQKDIISSQEVWIPPSALKVRVYPEPSCTTAPAEHLSLGIQLHYGSCYLLPPRTTVLPWAAHEGMEPHKQTSWAGESLGEKMFVCNGKMPTSKSLCSLPLWSIVSVAAGRSILLVNREQFFTPKKMFECSCLERKHWLSTFHTSSMGPSVCKDTLNSQGSTHLPLEGVVPGTDWTISLFSGDFAENSLYWRTFPFGLAQECSSKTLSTHGIFNLKWLLKIQGRV